jgi:hypothetical protein
VGHVRKKYELSERRVCKLLGFWRGTMRYRSQRQVAPELVEDLRQVAMERPRFGYRRLHVMLRRKGWSVNKKLVLRLVPSGGLTRCSAARVSFWDAKHVPNMSHTIFWHLGAPHRFQLSAATVSFWAVLTCSPNVSPIGE